jgi:DNA-binding response OmpR family regulator
MLDAVSIDSFLNHGFSVLLHREPDGSGVESEPEHFVAAELPPAVSVDVAMRIVKVHGQPVDLTPKEFDLLTLFVQNPGRPFSRDELLDRIWKSDYEVTDRTVDTHVLRLRKKLGQKAEVIQTVWGVGYKYDG